jgi:tyrosine-protein phosphatase SIW14
VIIVNHVKVHRVKSLGIFLALCVCVGAAQNAPQSRAQTRERSSPPTQRQMGSRKDYVGLPNFAEVSPTLSRGGQPGVDGLKALKKMGVTIIVDMRGSKSSHEQVAVQKLGMKYVAIPCHCPFPSDAIFARFLRLIKNNPRKKIFVHCRLGDDRTGMAIAAYRMADQGWSAEDALREMEEFGFTGPHHMICPTLHSYEKRFPKHLKDNPLFKDLGLQEELSKE